ncbi:MAG TPA: polymer-forming cytoskeletal protein [Allosphingosinicella sp.]|nr:polymer-forming cytoskeletal protein [Allosphingosinicella sp.]
MMAAGEDEAMFLKGGKAAGQSGSFSYLGSEVTVTGDIATESELHLDGKVVGDIACDALTQGQSGEVRGNIKAAEARLAGLVDGAVEAGRLTLEASARVTGDVLYESLSVAAGAEVDGRFRRRRGDGEQGSAAARKARTAPEPTPLFGEAEAAE